MKRIALRFRGAFRSAFGVGKAVGTCERRYELDPRAQVPPAHEEHVSSSDERTFERAFAERSSSPEIQYC
jgi:hypothetical protein